MTVVVALFTPDETMTRFGERHNSCARKAAGVFAADREGVLRDHRKSPLKGSESNLNLVEATLHLAVIRIVDGETHEKLWPSVMLSVVRGRRFSNECFRAICTAGSDGAGAPEEFGRIRAS